MSEVTRAEVDTLLYRFEQRAREDREEILSALRGVHDSVKDVKREMNGQFQAQGKLLADHQTAIKVLEDRGARDTTARWGVVIGGVLSVLAAYLGLK